MAELFFDLPSRLFFGPAALTKAAPFFLTFGKRAVLVSEPLFKKQDHLRTVRDSLESRGISVIVFSDTPAILNSSSLDNLISIIETSRTDMILGLGGIRVASMIRCASVGAAGGISAREVLSGGGSTGEFLPCIDIPTTGRNPLLFSDLQYLPFRESVSLVREFPRGMSRAVVVDPGFSLSLPVKTSLAMTISSMMDAVDGLVSEAATFLSNGLYAEALRRLRAAVPGVLQVPDHYTYREELSAGGVLCSLGARLTGPGPGAALCYAFHARFGLPKSWTGAVILPHLLDFYGEVRPEQAARVAGLLNNGESGFSSLPAPDRAAEEVRSMLGLLDLPLRLREFDLSPDDLRLAADEAAGLPFLRSFGSILAADDLYGILKQAY